MYFLLILIIKEFILRSYKIITNMNLFYTCLKLTPTTRVKLNRFNKPHISCRLGLRLKINSTRKFSTTNVNLQKKSLDSHLKKELVEDMKVYDSNNPRPEHVNPGYPDFLKITKKGVEE